MNQDRAKYFALHILAHIFKRRKQRFFSIWSALSMSGKSKSKMIMVTVKSEISDNKKLSSNSSGNKKKLSRSSIQTVNRLYELAKIQKKKREDEAINEKKKYNFTPRLSFNMNRLSIKVPNGKTSNNEPLAVVSAQLSPCSNQSFSRPMTPNY